jgi:hypothetical protein
MPRRILVAIIGVVIALGWLTLKDRMRGDGGDSSSNRIPAVVFGGGAATLTIEATTSEPAKVVAVFETNLDMGDPKHKLLETRQMVEAGTHTFTIDVPADVSGIVEVGIEEPTVGATVDLVCRINGQFVQRDAQRLEAPLEEGWGFAAQIEFDDFAKGALATD